MKYIYIRRKGSLDTARREVVENIDGVPYVLVDGEPTSFAYFPDLEIIPYELYRDITNGIIDAKLEALDDARYAFMKMHYEARKESRAKKLPALEDGF